MKILINLAAICMIVFLSSCGNKNKIPISSTPSILSIEKIKVGMSREEVKSLMGRLPSDTLGKSQDAWIYYVNVDLLKEKEQIAGWQITFINNLVSKISPIYMTNNITH